MAPRYLASGAVYVDPYAGGLEPTSRFKQPPRYMNGGLFVDPMTTIETPRRYSLPLYGEPVNSEVALDLTDPQTMVKAALIAGAAVVLGYIVLK